MRKWCAWAGLAFALAACKSSVPQPPAAVPDTCSTDSECQAHFRCDLELRRCVCTGDEACPGKFCNAFTGLCVESVGGCSGNDAGTVHCGQGQYCDAVVRTCKAVTAFCQ